MILYLNLLPHREKKRIRLEKIYNLLKKESLFLILLLMIVSLTIYFIKASINENIAKIDKSLEQNKEQHSALVKGIELFNKDLLAYRDLQADGFIAFSKQLLNLTEIVPDNIVLTEFSLDDHQVSFKGVYQKRDSLIAFKTILEEEYLSEIDFPISNLLNQEDSVFTISGSLNNYDD